MQVAGNGDEDLNDVSSNLEKTWRHHVINSKTFDKSVDTGFSWRNNRRDCEEAHGERSSHIEKMSLVAFEGGYAIA